MSQEYTIIVSNVVMNERTIKTVKECEFDKNILEVCGVNEQTDFVDVFAIDRNYFSSERFPYILVNGEIHWNVSYHCVSLRQFIETYNIVDYTINVKTGYPAASGMDVKSIADIWEYFCDYILPALTTVASVKDSYDVVKSVLEWIKKKAKEKNQDIFPDNIIDVIYRKDMWNYVELSRELKIEKEQGKYLLKGLGYKWNNSSKLYEINKKMKEKYIDTIKERIRKMKYGIMD